MKRIFLSFGLIILFTLFVLYRRIGSAEVNYVAPEFSQSPLPATSPMATPATSIQFIPTPKKKPGQYKDGQYIGSVADAYYGNVQVKITVQDGRIADVVFLDYPHDRRTSIEINAQAMPYLKQEAVQAQSANVDIVSGATATSGAFRESLASALSQAK